MDKTKRKEHKRITTNKTKARTLSLSWLNKPVTPHADFEESWERLDCKQHQKRLDTVSRSHGGGGGGTAGWSCTSENGTMWGFLQQAGPQRWTELQHTREEAVSLGKHGIGRRRRGALRTRRANSQVNS